MMYRFIMYIILIIILNILLTNPLYAWKIIRDFEGGTIGQEADSHGSGFDSSVPKFTFSDFRSKNGTKSGKLQWDPGATARGGRINFPSKLHEGDEVWYRAYFYFDTDFDWYAEPAVKIMRVWTASSSGNNQGYISIYKNNGSYDPDPPEIQLNNEPYTGGTQVSYTGTNFTDAGWQCLEMYVKFSTSQDGIVRIWKDGTLIAEDTSHNTMVDSDSKSTFVYIMSWWNGGCRATQAQWVDDVIITNERPSSQDPQGNYMIGPINYDSQTSIEPPEQLEVTHE